MILTYEDLVACGEDEVARKRFILRAIQQHKVSPEYLTAVDAQLYYDGENPTINKYEKIIYDMKGLAHRDMWTANHKIASQVFQYVIDQEVSYLLGNGVRFAKSETKDALGKTFDEDMQDALEYARIAGASFVFFNMNHLNVFKLTEFVPLYGEENGALVAGVRFWKLDRNKPLRATLYELDGYTDYIQRKGKSLEVLNEKRPYIETVTSSEADGSTITDGTNYAGFPIVPMYANKQHKSALNGKRNTVDAFDLITSNMVNNCDEGNLIYWVLTNCGGMDDEDDMKFVERLKTIHVAHADGDSGAGAEAHTVDAPIEGSRVTKDQLHDQLYDDFQAFDAKSMAAGDLSATAIAAGYTRLDMKCDKIERQVTRCITAILELAGIDDSPTYVRNKIINRAEEVQIAVMEAQYLPEDYTLKRLLTINGDIDMYDDVAKQMDEESARRIKELEDQLDDEANQGNDTDTPAQNNAGVKEE